VRRADKPYHLHVPIVLKSGSLSLLEPSGPVQACNGFALRLPYDTSHRNYVLLQAVPEYKFLAKSCFQLRKTTALADVV